MNAIDGNTLTPLAAPNSSPQKGSAYSRARWSSKVPIDTNGTPPKRASRKVADSPSDLKRATTKPTKRENRPLRSNSRGIQESKTVSSSSDSSQERGSRSSRRELQKDRRGRSNTPSSPRIKTRDRSNNRESIKARETASQKTRASSSNRSVSRPSASRPPLTSENKDTTGERRRSQSNGRGRPPATIHSTQRSTRGRSLSQSRPTHRRSSVNGNHPPRTQDNVTRQRSRSVSLTRVSNVSPSSRRCSRPPSTLRTRQQLLMCTPGRNRALSEADARSTHSSEIISFDSNESAPLVPMKPGGIMEKLFGNQVEKRTLTNNLVGSLNYEIRPRVLLAATVYHNTATSLWITTINTNQRGVAKNPATANKFLKAFSFATEREARESAIANAPPKMVPFNESPMCFCCKGKFAIFRRAGHCRNCGVCICSSCSTTWPAKMIPATYNLKNEAQVRICRSCNALSSSFKKALLDGDLEEAIALYGTGNINLRAPFPTSTKKDELMHPVHCAVQGGNLTILQWLIDDHFCPIKIHRAGSNKKFKRGNSENLILTSKGRSVLNIALDNLKVDILRYLVVDCGISVQETKDIKTTLRALEAALFALPSTKGRRPVRPETPGSTRWDAASFDDVSEPSSLGTDDYNDLSVAGWSTRSKASSRNGDSCIICFDRKIDCVATPCGHQVCCLACSQNLSSCPVCNDKGNFIKIFRP